MTYNSDGRATVASAKTKREGMGQVVSLERRVADYDITEAEALAKVEKLVNSYERQIEDITRKIEEPRESAKLGKLPEMFVRSGELQMKLQNHVMEDKITCENNKFLLKRRPSDEAIFKTRILVEEADLSDYPEFKSPDLAVDEDGELTF